MKRRLILLAAAVLIGGPAAAQIPTGRAPEQQADRLAHICPGS